MELIAGGRPFRGPAVPSPNPGNRPLRQLVDEGTVRRILKGVYVDVGAEDSLDLRVSALALVLGPDQVVVDRTAAWLHGIDCYSAVELAAGPAVEVCVVRGGTRTRRPGALGGSRDLITADTMSIGSVRVTTPLRTALDVGCNLRRREAFAAMCGLASAHGLTSSQLSSEAKRFKRRRGVIQLRELAPLVDPRLESPREAWTLLAVLDEGLPAPEPQHWIYIDGIPTFRLDLAWVAQRVCVEYDGFEAHDLDPDQRERDHLRRAWLRAHGWTIIVVKLGDFTGEALERWLLETRFALAPSYTTRRW